MTKLTNATRAQPGTTHNEGRTMDDEKDRKDECAFEVKVENEALIEALQPAFDAAQAANLLDGDQRGAIFCQIFAPGSLDRQDTVRVRGTFIERLYADHINKVLARRVRNRRKRA